MLPQYIMITVRHIAAQCRNDRDVISTIIHYSVHIQYIYSPILKSALLSIYLNSCWITFFFYYWIQKLLFEIVMLPQYINNCSAYCSSMKKSQRRNISYNLLFCVYSVHICSYFKMCFHLNFLKLLSDNGYLVIGRKNCLRL